MAGPLAGTKEGFNPQWAWDGAQAIRTMLRPGFESSLRSSEAGPGKNRKESQSGWWAGFKAIPKPCVEFQPGSSSQKSTRKR